MKIISRTQSQCFAYLLGVCTRVPRAETLVEIWLGMIIGKVVEISIHGLFNLITAFELGA